MSQQVILGQAIFGKPVPPHIFLGQTQLDDLAKFRRIFSYNRIELRRRGAKKVSGDPQLIRNDLEAGQMPVEGSRQIESHADPRLKAGYIVEMQQNCTQECTSGVKGR